VLDRVRHVGGGALDAGLFQRAVQQQSRRADERLALAILAIAGLFADQHDPCPG
jgi:hypothetical protein